MLLTAAMEHVRTLERRRIAVVKSAIQAFLTIYSCVPCSAAWPSLVHAADLRFLIADNVVSKCASRGTCSICVPHARWDVSLMRINRVCQAPVHAEEGWRTCKLQRTSYSAIWSASLTSTTWQSWLPLHRLLLRCSSCPVHFAWQPAACRVTGHCHAPEAGHVAGH